MKEPLEISLLKIMMLRPIADKPLFRQKKMSLDDLLMNKSSEELVILSDVLLSINQQNQDSKKYCQLYKNFIEKLIKKEPCKAPCLPVEIYLTETKTIKIFVQVFNKIENIFISRIHSNFQILTKSIEIRLTESIKENQKRYQRFSRRLGLKFIRFCAQKLKYSEFLYKIINIGRLVWYAKRFNKLKKAKNLLKAKMLILKKISVRELFYQTQNINDFFRRLDRSLERIRKIVEFKRIEKSFCAMQCKTYKSIACKKIVQVINEKITNQDMPDFFKLLKKNKDFMNFITKTFSRVYISLKNKKLQKLKEYAKIYKIFKNFRSLVLFFNLKAKSKNLCISLKHIKKLKLLQKILLTKTIRKMIKGKYLNIYKKILLKNIVTWRSINLAKSRLVSLYNDRTKEKRVTKFSKKLSLWVKKLCIKQMKKVEKYYRFPYSRGIVIHDLNSNNSVSTASEFLSILSIPKNIAREENLSFLRTLSVLDSSIENQRQYLANIDEENKKLIDLAKKSKKFIIYAESRILTLDQELAEVKKQKENKSTSRQNLEELHKEFRTYEENSVFLREEQRQRESKILTLNQGIKLLTYSVNEKTTDAIMYEKKLGELEYDYQRKCEEKEVLLQKNSEYSRRVNLSPVSNINTRNSFYRNNDRKESPLSRSSPLRIEERSTSFSRNTLLQNGQSEYYTKPDSGNKREVSRKLNLEEPASESSIRTKELLIILIFIVVIVLLIIR